MPRKRSKKNINAELKGYLDIEEEKPQPSKKYFGRSFLLVYGIENNLNNRDKKIITNGKDITALEAITETIRNLTFVNEKEAYKNHLDFIKASLSKYTEYNKKDSLLDKIRNNFKKMSEDVDDLEDILKKQNFTKDILTLFKDFYEKNANNQTIKNFITNNYYDLRGNKKTKESKKFLDLGIDIGNLRKKINIKDVKSEKFPFYLENLIEAMKYRYLIEKDKYDEYIYYMSKIAEIYQETEKIAPYKWEEKALVTQLLKLYNIDIKSAIKYIDVKKSKQKEEKSRFKIIKRKKQISDKLNFLDNSVKEFEKLIQSEEKTKRILKDEKIVLLKQNLIKVKGILKNYQDDTEVARPLDELEELELKVGEAEAQQEGEEEEEGDDDDDDEEEGGLTRRQVRNRSRGGASRKRTPIKRR